MTTPTVHVQADPPLAAETTRLITVRAAEGLDRVEVVVRIDKRTGPAQALRLLARAALEVCVSAREAAPRG